MTIAPHSTFESHNPATGQVLGIYPVQTEIDVSSAVERARVASTPWKSLGFSGRKKILLAWSKTLIDRIDECAELISRETGKPISDAKLEATLAIGHLAWAARSAEEILRTEHRRPGLIMANMSATVTHVPFGVIGVIGPWNYPIFTPMGSISYALAAGNTVVFKPSEYTPGVGLWLAETFSEAAESKDFFIAITGLADTGRALCESGVGKLAFTGSTKTAKKVAETCSRNMTPVVMECGGKDPVLVADDADIKTAVEFSLWSAMSNAGQTCIGAERIYVDAKISEEFISLFVAEARKITVGAPGNANYGPATMPSQIDVIQSHIADALSRGAEAAVGGLISIRPPFVEPVVLLNVPEDSLAMTEETFGPTIAINVVKNMDEAIALSNASRYGLAAAVWSRKNGEKIAEQLQCGMVSINSTISFAAVASVPFGGVKDSGYGRIHGPEGLLEFTYPRTIVRARFKLPLSFTTFKRTAFADKLIVGVVKVLHGRSIG